MVSTKASRIKRLRHSRGGTSLDEKRLRAIRRRIAAGYYNRREVRRTVAERIVSRILRRSEKQEAQS